jgi:hypothetical protein
MSKNIEKIEGFLNQIKNKENNLYFFAIDTKGNPSGSVAHMYETVRLLIELGYNAHVIHDKEDYSGVESWLGEEYGDIPHKLTKDIEVSPADMIIVPELFANVIEQLGKYNCKKLVFAQSYSYIFELLKIGTTWNYDYGFEDVLTTSEAQAEYIQKHFPNIKTHVIPVSIPEYFSEYDLPQKPTVGVMARDQSDVSRIIKSFYLQYPMYKWVTFKDLRGLPKQQFAEEVKQNCLSVWVDDIAGFGTFPLESMKCGVPVIGTVPDMLPEWMITQTEEGVTLRDNGVWTDNKLNLPELISEFIRLWLEDSIPVELYKEMEKMKGEYTSEKQKTAVEAVFGKLSEDRISEIENALKEIKLKEENEQE